MLNDNEEPEKPMAVLAFMVLLVMAAMIIWFMLSILNSDR